MRDSSEIDYVDLVRSEEYKSVVVSFAIENPKPLRIGDKMNELNEEAYMNGDNWSAFFNYYLSKSNPELLEGLKPDPEAGCYFASYDLTPDNERKAKKFVEIIKGLVENENKIYAIIENEGEYIEWD